ncbi:uncharacterized protein LOC132114105 [Carassius carassius]|uniref:uncharacterized protein LOC132114105 n=1 Tax=Carassius carassius TaxID=217509 RepID=UPI0028696E52|nr:uncharacterized protein LOC132114105 [Carassius carassius]
MPGVYLLSPALTAVILLTGSSGVPLEHHRAPDKPSTVWRLERVHVCSSSEESSRQEAPHSTGDLLAPVSPQDLRRDPPDATPGSHPHPAREQINWPKMSDNKEWYQLDQDLDKVLEATLAGTAEQKVNTLTTITYNLARERFGIQEKKINIKSAHQPNRREREIHRLRGEIKTLTKQFKRALADEREGIKDLTSQLRERLCRLRKAESTRKKRKDRENKRSQFTKDPFRFTRTLLGEAKSGKLTSPKGDVEAFLRETHNDTSRNQALHANPSISSIKIPEKELNVSEPSWREVQEVVKKARTGSAPGPSCIPYKVYKKCPMLLRRLWKLFRRIWRKGTIPSGWKKAEGCFVPKEENSSTIDQFRTISLLSVEGKIFFSVLAKRMTSYMTENGYINTAIQKGGIPGFSGCLEHTGVLSQMIREAKASKGNLTVVWLDLANAYGSIPHALIHTALDHYHIPQHIKRMITSYFGGIQLRFKAANFTTQWQSLEKAAEKEARGPKMESGIRQPPIRGYMDDLTVTTTTHVEARWVLPVLGHMATWARMKFKPKKSRSLVIRNGKLTNRFKMHVQGEVIPSIEENPIKCLGKWFDDSLTDRNNIASTEKQMEELLRRIEKSGLPGKFKAWLYQHGLLPRIMWLLTVYEDLEEEGRRSRAVDLASQGAWTRWDLPKRKITWADLW